MVAVEIPTIALVAFYLVAAILIIVLVFLCVLLYYVIKLLARATEAADDFRMHYRSWHNRIRTFGKALRLLRLFKL